MDLAGEDESHRLVVRAAGRTGTRFPERGVALRVIERKIEDSKDGISERGTVGFVKPMCVDC